MNLNKNYQIKKRPNHSSFVIYNPPEKLQDVKFRTYCSLETKRADQVQRPKEAHQIRTKLRIQLDVIESMSNRSWLRKPGQGLLHKKNVSDLMSLIKHQKSEHSSPSNSQFRSKHATSNIFSLKNEVNLNSVIPSIFGGFALDAPIARQRSNSHDYQDQPIKVKLFKKMSAFNKRENFDKLSSQRQMMPVKICGFPQSTLLKKRKKGNSFKKDDQMISLQKQTAQSTNQPEIRSPDRAHHLRKQESMLCRGEILAKDDELTRRKRCIRQLSIIERQMDEGSKQPVFLFQI